MIFADEPTGALDTETGKDILTLLREAVDGLDQTVVMVTHDPIAAANADTVVFLADGQIVETMDNPSSERVAERMTHLGLRTMLRIAFSTLAARKSGTVGAFAAVSLAVVLVVSCGILAGVQPARTDPRRTARRRRGRRPRRTDNRPEREGTSRPCSANDGDRAGWASPRFARIRGSRRRSVCVRTGR